MKSTKPQHIPGKSLHLNTVSMEVDSKTPPDFASRSSPLGCSVSYSCKSQKHLCSNHEKPGPYQHKQRCPLLKEEIVMSFSMLMTTPQNAFSN